MISMRYAFNIIVCQHNSQISTIFCATHFRQSYGLDALCFQYKCLSAQFSKFYLISTFFASLIFARNMSSMRYAFNINVCQHKSQSSTKFLPFFASPIFARNMASMCYAFNIHVTVCQFYLIYTFFCATHFR